MSEYYSDLKITHHMTAIENLKNKKKCYPVSLRLVISDLCNHNCHFCTFRMENSLTNTQFGVYDYKKQMVNYNPRRFLSKEKAFEVIEDCKVMGVKSIEFTGGGEPQTHPDHVEIFNKAINEGLDVGVITNGYLMRGGFTDTILKSMWCRFSLDAGTSKSYSMIREVPETAFNTVLNNIKHIATQKKEQGSETTLGVSFIVTEENYLEVFKAAKIVSTLGVDYFRVGYYRTDEGFVTGNYEKVCSQLNEAKKAFETTDFKISDRFSEASENINEQPDYRFCGYQHISTWISADYNLYRCCVTSYDEHGLIGSIKNQSFKDLWDSNEKLEKMKNFNAKSCSQCIYNNKNKVINYLLKDKKDHINFM